LRVGLRPREVRLNAYVTCPAFANKLLSVSHTMAYKCFFGGGMRSSDIYSVLTVCFCSLTLSCAPDAASTELDDQEFGQTNTATCPSLLTEAAYPLVMENFPSMCAVLSTDSVVVSTVSSLTGYMCKSAGDVTPNTLSTAPASVYGPLLAKALHPVRLLAFYYAEGSTLTSLAADMKEYSDDNNVQNDMTRAATKASVSSKDAWSELGPFSYFIEHAKAPVDATMLAKFTTAPTTAQLARAVEGYLQKDANAKTRVATGPVWACVHLPSLLSANWKTSGSATSPSNSVPPQKQTVSTPFKDASGETTLTQDLCVYKSAAASGWQGGDIGIVRFKDAAGGDAGRDLSNQSCSLNTFLAMYFNDCGKVSGSKWQFCSNLDDKGNLIAGLAAHQGRWGTCKSRFLRYSKAQLDAAGVTTRLTQPEIDDPNSAANPQKVVDSVAALKHPTYTQCLAGIR